MVGRHRWREEWEIPMDPLTVAAGAVALLTPYLSKAAEQFAGEAGKAAWAKAQSLFGKLKAAFARAPGGKDVVARFESAPKDSKDEMESVLGERLQQDRVLLEEVAATLAEVKRLGPVVKVVQTIEEAEDVVGVRARRLSGQATVDVRQDMDRAKNVIGAQFDEIS
jgi:hypothetical protein